MSALSRFEQFMEQMVEGSVARLFRSPVQPVEIARRLERAMESQQSISVNRVIVPSFYRAFLNPADFTAFQPVRAQLEQEMATYLSELAQERGFAMLEHPQVVLGEDGAVARRSIQVVAELTNTSTAETTKVMTTPASAAAPARRSQASLLLQTPQGPQAITLASTAVSIGRGLGNDIILEDARVSRHHAQLRYRQRRFWLADLGSTNGTFLNGQPITESALRDGDLISLGGLELTFREQA
ncbi:MAG: FhaA domain-containing protein [Oscillochloridaceae bacterium umkhey_bin13]